MTSDQSFPVLILVSGLHCMMTVWEPNTQHSHTNNLQFCGEEFLQMIQKYKRESINYMQQIREKTLSYATETKGLKA